MTASQLLNYLLTTLTQVSDPPAKEFATCLDRGWGPEMRSPTVREGLR
jgi:hypothetical protein